MELLKNHITQFVTPTQDELDSFFSDIEVYTIKDKACLVQEGQYCKHTHFILQGCFRSFFTNEKGIQKTINFGIENWWITDFDSFINQTRSHITIQAVEDSIVVRIHKKHLDHVLNHSLSINKYFRIIMEKVRIADQRRIQFLFNLSGEELYHTFYNHNPTFAQRVPQYMLASYLGFTPEFLSKIRSKKKHLLS